MKIKKTVRKGEKMHIWVDFSHLPLKKRGETYHMTSHHWGGGTSRDLSSSLMVTGHITWSFLVTEIVSMGDGSMMVSWTIRKRSGGQSIKVPDWLLGLEWIDIGCFRQSDLGTNQGLVTLSSPPVSPLSSQVPVPLIGHFTAVNYHLSHLGENPFLLGWGLKRRNLNLEVCLWLLLHQERMPYKTSDLFFFLNGHTFEQIVLIPALSKRGGRTICEYKWSNKFHS